MFNNVMIYQLMQRGSDYLAVLDRLNGPQHEQVSWKPTTPGQAMSVGLVPPHSEDPDDPLTVNVGDRFIAFALKIETALLPPSIVSAYLRVRVKDIEERQGRKIYRKERLTIRDELVADLLPRALRQHKIIRGYFDVEANTVVIGTATASTAELCLNVMREALGGLKVMVPYFNMNVPTVYTRWIEKPDDMPENFAPLSDVKLKGAEDGEKIATKMIYQPSDILHAIISEGFEVSEIKVRYLTDLNCTVTELGYKFKSIKWLGDPPDDQDEIEELDRFRADFWTQARTIAGLFDDLASGLGGLHHQLNIGLEGESDA